MALSEAQERALRMIAAISYKSGRFWRDLGVTPQTIARLESDNLVGAAWRPATGETTILRRSWVATPAGRAALGEKDGE